ncbi:MAG TPA: phytanoyl-CoA dioxygenase family protein [Rhizomicrobium sp.]|jgi:hypothetical protein
MNKIRVSGTGISPSRAPRAWAIREELLLNGYALVPRALDSGLAEQLRRDIKLHAVAKSSASRDRTLLDGYPRLESIRLVVENEQIRDLALAVCGEDARLHAAKGAVRAAGEGELSLHTDTAAVTSSPFVRSAQFFTVHIICEPFEPEHGATFFVPYSHRLLRNPTSTEADSADRVCLSAEPGDLLCWLGETWHGRYSRTTPGERVSLFLMFTAADIDSD